MIERLRDLWRRVSFAQQSRLFKVVATVVVALAALAVIGASALSEARDSIDTQAGQTETATPADEAPKDYGEARRVISDILGGQDQDVGVYLTTLIVAGVSLVVIWLGLAITYLALVGVSGAIAWVFGGVLGAEGLSRLLLGMIALIASFAALLQGLRALFGGRGPVFAIARNVLAEAVRLKVSLVFIVLLVFALAAIPGLIDSQDALRYRVQSLLQYGTGGSFWIIALLIVLLSVASVAFDQRDRTIWQTMTKPVSAWQYIAGKWLGIAGLSAVLLGVCASGIFLFTDYIRNQPAKGEIQPYVSATGLISEDRMILESRILTARVGKKPDPPITQDNPDFLASVEAYIDNQRAINPTFAEDDEEFAEVVDSLYKSYIASRYRLVPGQWREFVFEGMGGARSSDRLITLHLKVKTNANNPTHFYRLRFSWEGANSIIEKVVSLGTINRIEIPNDAVLDDGDLVIYIMNAGRSDDPSIPPEILNIPEADGIEIAYSVGSYHLNFARVVFVLWVKLMFLSIIALTAATFLSFPVAVLMSLTVFLSAEGAGYIASSLESFRIQNQQGETIIINLITEKISIFISNLFSVYADLRPTSRLVEGRLLSWGEVAVGVLVLGAVSAAMFVLACLIFRRRELATYSGH